MDNITFLITIAIFGFYGAIFFYLGGKIAKQEPFISKKQDITPPPDFMGVDVNEIDRDSIRFTNG